MIRIHSIKKSKKHYVVEFLKDDHVFLHTLYEEVIIQFMLFRAKELDELTYQALLKENAYYEAHHYLLDKLKKRLTEAEVRALLHQLETSSQINERIIAFLYQHRLLDDALYAKDYVMMTMHQKGPNYIRKRLLDKGISQTLVNQALSLYNETIEREGIMRQVNRLLNAPIKLPKAKLKEKWVRTLIQQGYTPNLVYALVSEGLAKQPEPELPEVLRKDLYKALRACKNDRDNTCKNKVIRKLMQKGHHYEAIQTMIREEGCFDETETCFE